MAFIRTRKITKKTGKTFEYAYIVENRRVRKKIKQEIKKTLGRVYRPDRVNVMDFYEYFSVADVDVYIESKSKQEIVEDLLKLVLFNYGFTEKGNVLVNGKVYFDLKKKRTFNEKGKDVAIAMNEGYLTGYALWKILKFIPEDEESGWEYAKMFVEAGFVVPKDVFVGIFSKVYK